MSRSARRVDPGHSGRFVGTAFLRAPMTWAPGAATFAAIVTCLILGARRYGFLDLVASGQARRPVTTTSITVMMDLARIVQSPLATAASVRGQVVLALDWALVCDGGGVCESNTPGTLFTPHAGFEDQGHHQGPSASIGALSRTAARGVKPPAEEDEREGFLTPVSWYQWVCSAKMTPMESTEEPLPGRPSEQVFRSRRRVPRPQRWILGAVAAMVAVVVLFAATALWTDRPQFCGSCHEMRPYVDRVGQRSAQRRLVHRLPRGQGPSSSLRPQVRGTPRGRRPLLGRHQVPARCRDRVSRTRRARMPRQGDPEARCVGIRATPSTRARRLARCATPRAAHVVTARAR